MILKVLLVLMTMCDIAWMANVECGSLAKLKGTIKSPNSGKIQDEKGVIANCLWELQPPKGNHYLKIVIMTLSLFYKRNDGEKVCPGSYKLTVLNDQLDCKMYVNSFNASSSSYCMAFYHSQACKGVADAECDRPANSTSFPVNVTYVSDGRSNFTGRIEGFEAKYEFKKCPVKTTMSSDKPSPTGLTAVNSTTNFKETSATSEILTETAARTTVPSKPSAMTSKRFITTGTTIEIKYPTVSTMNTTGSHSSRATVSAKDELSTSAESSSSSSTTIIIIVVAVIGVLVAVIIIVVYFKNRKKQSVKGVYVKESVTKDNNTSRLTEENPVRGSDTSDNPTVETGAQSAVTVNAKSDTTGYEETENAGYVSVDDLEESSRSSGKAGESGEPRQMSSSGRTNRQADETYCSVRVTNNSKETVRYNKGMVDNVLYGTH